MSVKTGMDRNQKAILISIITNVVLIILRLFLADLSGSLGLRAGAWHSFADVFVSGVVFAGLVFTGRGTGNRAGRQKIENIVAIFVSVFILYMGIEIMSDAFSGEPVELEHIWFAASGSLLAVIINFFLARYKIHVGEQTGSQSLTADGYHTRMDMYCSIAVLIGLLGSLFNMPNLDKTAAIITMILLIAVGLEILIINLRMLLKPATENDHNEDLDHPGHSHFSFLSGKKKVLLFAGIGITVVAAWFLLELL